MPVEAGATLAAVTGEARTITAAPASSRR